ncbi:unnamed protein product [Trichogramma brassicae]|uniref:Death-associated protein 1 n=2 Tax=Trichogramma TaxID=7490 RepID=A0A6H5IGQ7_9HYME|nr:death-associated protein 1 [Trichogramma pretiosum]CAB0037361.1 unnamed protein product [Trichogramma brassicae]
MSSPEESSLKAGHPPAVKAGGMRITQHKHSDKEREVKPTKDPEELKTSTSPPKAMIVSGVQTKGHADFPPEAVQHYHDKPVPTHEARSSNYSRPIVIQQPRK